MARKEIECSYCDGTGMDLNCHNSTDPKDVGFCSVCRGKSLGEELTCDLCDATVYKLLPHPQDHSQETEICEDCEYEVIARYEALSNEPIENYEDIRGK